MADAMDQKISWNGKRNWEDLEDYHSDFDEEGEERDSKQKQKQTRARHGLEPETSKSQIFHYGPLPPKQLFEEERRRADSYKNSYGALNAFERHRKLVNDYMHLPPGDSSRDKTDRDVLRENHRFLWREGDPADTWEKQMAKRYYDKLFKEYCISDLSLYRQKKIGLRWRTQREVIDGKGQFTCGAKGCDASFGLRSWEVNFAYMEESVKKNALVKLRLCGPCSLKLETHNWGTEVKPKPKSKSKRRREDSSANGQNVDFGGMPLNSYNFNLGKKEPVIVKTEETEEGIWAAPVQAPGVKSREEEFLEYFGDLLQ